MMEYEISVMVTYAGILVLIFVLGKLLKWPIRIATKCAVSSFLGGVGIMAVNWLWTLAGGMTVLIPLNFVTAVMVGVLGIPGALFLLIGCLVSV